MTNLCLLACTAATGFWVMGAAAAAQEAPDSASTSAEIGVEEVVVTARRREETMQQVPSSVAILGAQQLEQAGSSKLSDIQFSVPNLYFGNPNNSTQTSINIRGVGDFSRNIGMDMRVSVYVDGVYVGRSLAVNQQLLDMERVEVLRGPQGTLFGKNTVAGAINLITRKPDAVASGWVDAGAGNFNLVKASGGVNIPLSDRVFIKAGVNYRERDGYILNRFNGQHPGDENVKSARLQLRALPTDSLTVDLAADASATHNASFQNAEGDYVLTPAITSPGFSTAPGPYDANTNSPGLNETDLWGVSATATWDRGDAGAIVGIVSHRDGQTRTTNDEDAGPAFIADSEFRTWSEQTTGELRYDSPADARLRYVLGLYYYDEHARSEIGARSPILAPTVPGNVLVDDGGVADQTSYAVFANAEWDLTDKLVAELGGRYLWEDRSVDFTQLSTNPALGLASFRKVDSFDDTAFTPSGSLTYSFNSDVRAYVRLSRGYKSGGFNADVVSNSNIAFAPESVDAVEVGLKTELLNRRLRLNVAAFGSRHSDYQVFQFTVQGNSTVIQLRNAGEAESKGFELEASAFISPELSLNAGLGYADATFTDFPACSGLTVNCRGDRLPGAPQWTGSFSALYQPRLIEWLDSKLFLQYNYRDAVYTDVPNTPAKQTQSLGTVNARLTLHPVTSPVEFYVFADNLFDEARIQSAAALFLRVPTTFYNMPRTYGVGFRAEF